MLMTEEEAGKVMCWASASRSGKPFSCRAAGCAAWTVWLGNDGQPNAPELGYCGALPGDAPSHLQWQGYRTELARARAARDAARAAEKAAVEPIDDESEFTL